MMCVMKWSARLNVLASRLPVVTLFTAVLASATLVAGCAAGGASEPSPVANVSSQFGSWRPPTDGQPARLHVSGDQVVDPSGHPIVLRGYNWGQWGTAQPQDAASNVRQGANSVRIPLRWWGKWKPGVDSRDVAAPGHIDPTHLAQLDKTIRSATNQRLWVDLFVDSNYGQGANGSKDNFWTDPTLRTQFFQMWTFLAARYAHTPYMGALELLPEPRAQGVSDAAVRSFYNSLITTVRKVDARTPIIIGPNDGYSAAHLVDAHTTIDKNLIYTADYFIFDHPLQKLSQLRAFRARFHDPVWVNQVGIPSGNPDSESKARTVLSALNKVNIGWAWWTYRDLGTKSTGEGIFYRSSTSSTAHWIVKTPWLSLVGSYLYNG